MYADCTSSRQNLNGIDLVKFLCAFLVFMIHIPPLPEDSTGFARIVYLGLRHGVCRIAVPFYFVCSGYFLFRKMPVDALDTDAIKGYCFKILRLVGTWHVLLFWGSTGHLWYLGATVIAVILLSLCFRFHIKNGLICLLACVLYAIGLLGDSYRTFLAPLENISVIKYLFMSYDFAFRTTRNGVFMGFIFVFLGASLAHHGKILQPRPAAIGLTVSLICLLAEAYLLAFRYGLEGADMYISLVPAVYFLFSLAYSVPLKDRPIYRSLRTICMLIYFLHLLVAGFVSLALSVVEKYMHIAVLDYYFILVLTATLFLATCIQWLSRKEKFKWINWLLS
jgi:serine/alanine racemase